MFKVIPVPAFKDNYIWVIIHLNTQRCVIIDPGESEPVLRALTEYHLQPVAILITHHHQDHSGGIAGILNYFSLPVFAPSKENIPDCNMPLHDRNTVDLPSLELNLLAMAIPGHTLGHMAYYGEGMLFSGDTLFTGGCGRVFEGTAQEMFDSLQKLKALPDTTNIYCGHEYTEANLKFALTVEPHNLALQERMQRVQQLRAQKLPTVPSTLEIEKMTNPFLRTDIPAVKAAAEKQAGHALANEVEVFATLRSWKNHF